jgi:undecaprenyl-diphosphatase
MNILHVAFLALIQGLAELLPVSSSAHVILASRLLGLDPASPEMTFLLVMLHTGTMFAVLVYFGKRWAALLKNREQLRVFAQALVIATAGTGVLGLALKVGIEKVLLEHLLHRSKGEVEELFGWLPLIGTALAAVGLFILYAGLRGPKVSTNELSPRSALLIGIVQGLCLPFRGFSRSGATISTGLLLGLSRELAEELSFAMAVVLTPPVVLLELKRLLKFHAALPGGAGGAITTALVGLVLSFFAGLLALKWLSAWLEKGRWWLFGAYCLALSAVIFIAYFLLPATA